MRFLSTIDVNTQTFFSIVLLFSVSLVKTFREECIKILLTRKGSETRLTFKIKIN